MTHSIKWYWDKAILSLLLSYKLCQVVRVHIRQGEAWYMYIYFCSNTFKSKDKTIYIYLLVFVTLFHLCPILTHLKVYIDIQLTYTLFLPWRVNKVQLSQTLYYVYKQKGIDSVKLFQTSTVLVTIGGLGTYTLLICLVKVDSVQFLHSFRTRYLDLTEFLITLYNT